jgi:hypothetical protein
MTPTALFAQAPQRKFKNKEEQQAYETGRKVGTVAVPCCCGVLFLTAVALVVFLVVRMSKSPRPRRRRRDFDE